MAERVGLFAAWWHDDPLPPLPAWPELASRATDDIRQLAGVTGLDSSEARSRLRDGHRAYLAIVGSEVIGCGWSATRRAEIGVLDLSFELPPGNRYLWDFVTFPAWRGRGVYPRLLQAILAAEGSEASRFWIGYDWDNVASARGVEKAGFQVVGEVDRLPDRLALVALGPRERAEAIAAIVGVELLH
jgi:RimJ/RimL family protein N-acetyltransferase